MHAKVTKEKTDTFVCLSYAVGLSLTSSSARAMLLLVIPSYLSPTSCCVHCLLSCVLSPLFIWSVNVTSHTDSYFISIILSPFSILLWTLGFFCIGNIFFSFFLVLSMPSCFFPKEFYHHVFYRLTILYEHSHLTCWTDFLYFFPNMTWFHETVQVIRLFSIVTDPITFSQLWFHKWKIWSTQPMPRRKPPSEEVRFSNNSPKIFWVTSIKLIPW